MHHGDEHGNGQAHGHGQRHTHGHGHSHAHGLGHSPSHAAASAANRRRLAWVLGVVLVYMVAEFIGGLLTNSLALLADAGHMLSDAGALALSLFAVWLSGRPAGAQRTYGHHRTEILAALANGLTLVLISAFIFYEAFRRIGQPPEVQGGLMMVIAVGGLFVNIAGLAILSGGRDSNLNIRGAWLHVLTDALGSVGAIVAGALILFFGWNWADPAASIAIALLVLYSSWGLLRETVDVLLEAAPRNIDVEEVRTAILRVDGVKDLHDLHVWTITSGLPALSAHLVVNEVNFTQETLERARNCLHDRFGIEHVTLQLELEGFDEIHTCV